MFGDGELEGEKEMDLAGKRGGKPSKDRPFVSTAQHSRWNTIRKD